MRPPSYRRTLLAVTLAFLASLIPSRLALALDKQGAAHAGAAGKEEEKGNLFDFEGAVIFGMSLYNPTYAARPDNTGLTLFRYALHADMDLLGEKLSIPIDLNMFTDGTKHGAQVFSPTEGDVILGVTSTWPALRGKLELGARVEHDRPLDRGGFTQTYADTRARYIYSLRSIWPGVDRVLDDGDISGWFTLGWFAFNPTYAARPDNTGIALMRYGWHNEISFWHDHFSIGEDATFFSDRRADNPFAPSEIDFTPELIFRTSRYEFHLAFERDHPIDRAGLVQEFVYALAVVEFDLIHDQPPPLEERTHIISP